MIHLAYYDYGAGDAASAAAFLILGLFGFLFAIVAYVISAFLLSKVFEKAGVQGKWRAWVPIYNYLVLAKLGDFSPWVILGLVVASAIPVLQYLAGLALFVALIMVAYRVNAKFGRDWPILLLFILGPLGQWIWLGILAFGSNPWNPNIQPSPWANSFLADKTVWNGIPVQPGQQVQAPPATGGYGAPAAGYAPPAQPYSPPQTPPAAGTTPPPPAPPAGPTPPPPAGPQS
ncbi:large exoprotein [Microbacterium enclense]|uniref:large exoprotein n=1 Tax=Microbacterium enclense TaxID=993073 RepID=UPI0013E3A21F|nr:large exoprotein [Microbacterium enclense]